MDSLKKMTIVVAAVCVLIGLLAAALPMGMMQRRQREAEKVTPELKTFDIDDSFTSIRIDEINCDVTFYEAKGNACQVVCTENKYLIFDVTADSGILEITQKDESKWFDKFGETITDQYILHVFLPETKFNSVKISTVSGSIDLPEQFKMKKLEAVTVTGDVTVNSSVTESANIATVSGNTVMNRSLLEDFDYVTVGGDLKLSEVTVIGEMSFDSTSGNIELTNCDAEEIEISTVGGSVTASFLTEKEIHAETVSGTVNVPKTVEGAGRCDVDTVSGDITVTMVG